MASPTKPKRRKPYMVPVAGPLGPPAGGIITRVEPNPMSVAWTEQGTGVHGLGFAPGVVVQIDGVDQAMAPYHSPTLIYLSVFPSTFPPGVTDVTVTNPGQPPSAPHPLTFV